MEVIMKTESQNIDIASLDTLVDVFLKITNPRIPEGLVAIFTGCSPSFFSVFWPKFPIMAEVERWAKRYWHILRERLTLADCRIILRVGREVFDASHSLLSHDTRCFITSLDPSKVTASDLQKLVRDHWQVSCFLLEKD